MYGALRETHEELGIDPKCVEILGEIRSTRIQPGSSDEGVAVRCKHGRQIMFATTHVPTAVEGLYPLPKRNASCSR